jgi:hypothetical protein
VQPGDFKTSLVREQCVLASELEVTPRTDR